MPSSATAMIIAFPGRAATPAAAARAADKGTPSPEEARLARALANLNEAVTAQRAAMAVWKSSLGDLRTVTRRLNTSLRSYGDSLSRLDARVATLRGEAAKLELWADEAMTRQG